MLQVLEIFGCFAILLALQNRYNRYRDSMRFCETVQAEDMDEEDAQEDSAALKVEVCASSSSISSAVDAERKISIVQSDAGGGVGGEALRSPCPPKPGNEVEAPGRSGGTGAASPASSTETVCNSVCNSAPDFVAAEPSPGRRLTCWLFLDEWIEFERRRVQLGWPRARMAAYLIGIALAHPKIVDSTHSVTTSLPSPSPGTGEASKEDLF